MKPKKALSLVRAALRLSDDLRRPQYRGDPNPYVGHCYVAAEAVWHLLGGAGSDWKPYVVRVEDDTDTHWFLRHKDGRIADPTWDQFDSDSPPDYNLGRCTGFLTKQPSRRAQELIRRSKGDYSVRQKRRR